MFVDFGILPPEVNSGRMYVGPGSGPMLAAAAAWDELAAELQTTAASYGSTVDSLSAGPWTGPSSIAMAAAAAPYVAWINAAGAQAELAGTQAKLAAAAYESAFAGTVPPPVIAANRALLAALVATNIFGQNTPAIMATEAHYMEMWAQDAAAMYAYAGSSATASQLTPFTEPPQTTNSSGTGLQSAAVSQASTSSGLNVGTKLSQLINSVPTWLQNLGSTLGNTGQAGGAGNLLSGLDIPQLANISVPASLTTDLTNWNTIMSTIASGPYSLQGLTSIPGGPFLSFGQVYAYAQNGQGLQSFFAPAKPITGALAPLASELPAHVPGASLAGSATSASMGRAALVGSMSVPNGWTQAAPQIRMLASTLPANLAAAPEAAMAGDGSMFSQMALSSLAGRGMGAGAFGSGGGAAARAMGGVIEADPAAATILVIPAFDED